jgi:hypothetical protein
MSTIGLLASIAVDTTVAAISEATSGGSSHVATSGSVVSADASVSVSTGSGSSLVSLAEATSSLSSGVVAGGGIPAVVVSLLVGGTVAVALSTLGTSVASPVVSEASAHGVSECSVRCTSTSGITIATGLVGEALVALIG